MRCQKRYNIMYVFVKYLTVQKFLSAFVNRFIEKYCILGKKLKILPNFYQHFKLTFCFQKYFLEKKLPIKMKIKNV